MAGHCFGDAADVHGGAGYGHRVGGAALHCREPVFDQLRGDVGADQLPGGECGDSAGVELVCAAVRAQAVPADLRGHFHGRLVLLRSGALAGGDSAGAGAAGRGRRSAAAVVAVDPAGELSASQAIDGHGGLWSGDCGGAGAGAHAGRLADRHLQLAVCVLHQHPGWHAGGDPDCELRPRSAVHQERESGRRSTISASGC